MNNEDLLKLVNGEHPLQDVVEAYLRGEPVQFRQCGWGTGRWSTIQPGNIVQNIAFDPDEYEYCIAPQLLNGVEVPRGVSRQEADRLPQVFIPLLQTYPGGNASVQTFGLGFGRPYREAVNGGYAFKTREDALRYGEALFKLDLEDSNRV